MRKLALVNGISERHFDREFLCGFVRNIGCHLCRQPCSFVGFGPRDVSSYDSET